MEKKINNGKARHVDYLKTYLKKNFVLNDILAHFFVSRSKAFCYSSIGIMYIVALLAKGEVPITLPLSLVSATRLT